MPEGLQQSERGQKMESAIEALDTAVHALEEAYDSINEAVMA